MQSEFEARKDGNGLLHAGVGWDVFSLCPDRALAAFELSAKMGNAIGAYNAAMIRIERGHKGDREAAIALLKQAVALKDKKSEALLAKLSGATTKAQ